MSFFENVRSAQNHTGNGPNPYYEKILSEQGKTWLRGYDTAVEDMVTLFYNLDVYSQDFFMAGFNTFDVEDLDEEGNQRIDWTAD
jgi:hypothetical protein